MEVKSESKSCIEKDESLGWGKSLPVPCVQEIVKNDPNSVPHRYIRDHKDRPVFDQLPPNFSEIPAINSCPRDQHEQKKLDSARKEWGFFQIINRGIGEELMQKMKRTGTSFFDLEMEEKQKYSIAENDTDGYGQAFVVYEEQNLDWSDIMILVTNPRYRNLKYWPLTLPDLVLGISLHSDSGTITILLQDDHITALQIHHHWIPVKPLPGAFMSMLVILENSPAMYRSINCIDYMRHFFGC
ncbi:hypothetical protein K1719_024417 [Acacia pycnantha]|nr:hypothetical protein K1719_024417 [Acacia pycnantha]